MIKKIFLTIFLLFICSQSNAAIAYVQSKVVAKASLSFDAQPAVNNLIVVGVTTWAEAIGANVISDNHGNSYTRIITTVNGSVNVALFYAISSTVGTPFTVSTGTLTDYSTAILEYSGTAIVSVLDKSVGATGSSTTPSSGNVVTTLPGDLYIGITGHDGGNISITAGAGYTMREELEDGTILMVIGVEEKIAAAGTHAATFTLSSSQVWAASIAVFKEKDTDDDFFPFLTKEEAEQIYHAANCHQKTPGIFCWSCCVLPDSTCPDNQGVFIDGCELPITEVFSLWKPDWDLQSYVKEPGLGPDTDLEQQFMFVYPTAV